MQLSRLPIKSLSKEALVLPFRYFPSFLHLAIVPVGLIFLSAFLGGLLAGLTGHSFFNFLWIGCTFFFQAPFFVGWAKLVAEGSSSIGERSYFTFGTTEKRFVIASILLPAFLFVPGGVAGWWAYNSGSATVPIVVATMLFVIGITIGFRLMFLLTTIALERYAGLKETWHLSKGVVLRTFLIVMLAGIPIHLFDTIVRRNFQQSSYTDISTGIGLGILDIGLRFLSSATTIGALVLCYQFKTGETTEHEAPLVSTGFEPSLSQ
jgi:hypothetical protein